MPPPPRATSAAQHAQHLHRDQWLCAEGQIISLYNNENNNKFESHGTKNTEKQQQIRGGELKEMWHSPPLLR